MAGPNLKMPQHPYYLRSMDKSPNSISPNHKLQDQISPIRHYNLREKNQNSEKVAQLKRTMAKIKEKKTIKTALKKVPVESKSAKKKSVKIQSNLISQDGRKKVKSSADSNSKKPTTRAKTAIKSEPVIFQLENKNNSQNNIFTDLNVTDLINSDNTKHKRLRSKASKKNSSQNDIFNDLNVTELINSPMNSDNTKQKRLKSGASKKNSSQNDIFTDLNVTELIDSPMNSENTNHKLLRSRVLKAKSYVDDNKNKSINNKIQDATTSSSTELKVTESTAEKTLNDTYFIEETDESENCSCNPETNTVCFSCLLRDDDSDDISWKASEFDIYYSDSDSTCF